MKNKLFQINVDANHGSNGGIMQDIGETMLVSGWDSYIAYGRKVQPSKSNLIRIGTKWDTYGHVLESRLFDNHGLSSRLATLKLIKKMKEIQPNIVHFHNIHGYYINYRILLQYLAKNDIPTVFTMHDEWAYTGHCAFHDPNNCSKWETHCENCPAYRHYPSSWFFDRSYQNFELKKRVFSAIPRLYLVPVSSWLGNLTKKSFLGDRPIIPIHNGIDTEIFHPIESNIREKYNIVGKRILLGVASTWNKGKGLQEFLNLSKISTYQVILVGVSKTQKEYLPPNIIAIDRTECREQLAEFYSVADVFVTPSYCDTFSTVCLEAQSCGTPVVTYDTGGNSETIDDSTGIVVERGNYKMLLEAIERVLSKDREKYRVSCRNRILRNFKKEDRYQDYKKLYYEILDIK